MNAKQGGLLEIVARNGRSIVESISVGLPFVGPEEAVQDKHQLQDMLQQWGAVKSVMYKVAGRSQPVAYSQFISDFMVLLEQRSVEAMQALVSPGAEFEGLGTLTVSTDGKAVFNILLKYDIQEGHHASVRPDQKEQQRQLHGRVAKEQAPELGPELKPELKLELKPELKPEQEPKESSDGTDREEEEEESEPVHKFLVLKVGSQKWDIVYDLVEVGDAFVRQGQLEKNLTSVMNKDVERLGGDARLSIKFSEHNLHIYDALKKGLNRKDLPKRFNLVSLYDLHRIRARPSDLEALLALQREGVAARTSAGLLPIGLGPKANLIVHPNTSDRKKQPKPDQQEQSAAQRAATPRRAAMQVKHPCSTDPDPNLETQERQKQKRLRGGLDMEQEPKRKRSHSGTAREQQEATQSQRQSQKESPVQRENTGDPRHVRKGSAAHATASPPGPTASSPSLPGSLLELPTVKINPMTQAVDLTQLALGIEGLQAVLAAAHPDPNSDEAVELYLAMGQRLADWSITHDPLLALFFSVHYVQIKVLHRMGKKAAVMSYLCHQLQLTPMVEHQATTPVRPDSRV